MRKKREIQLIEYEEKFYVQRPQSWIGGWARHLLIEKTFPKKVQIASPDFWKKISKKGKKLTLTVYEDGTSKVI